MEFRVRRASEWDDDVQPCEGSYTRFNENGLQCWYIRVPTINKLMKFVNEHRRVVIYAEDKEILIYDTWIE